MRRRTLFSAQHAHPESTIPITRLMTLLGAFAACVFALTIPSVYCAISMTAKQRTLAMEASVLARSIETIVQSRPDLWEFEQQRLLELISRPSIHGRLAEREVRTAEGETIAKTDFSETSPTLSVSETFFDSGQLAGSIVAKDSMRTEAIVTAILGVLSSILGYLIYFIFRVYPIRKLEGTLADLHREKSKLRRHTVELEQTNMEIRQFAYAVCHDLRTPLVNLRGFSCELEASLKTLTPAIDTALSRMSDEEAKSGIRTARKDISDFLEFIDSSAMAMGHRLNALLGLSRLGRRTLSFETLDMEEIVAEALKALAQEIEAAKTHICVGPLPEVVADRVAMKQIVGNILTNAVKYLVPGRPGEIEIAAQRDETATTFVIRDNGRGIATDDLPKVFAPFRRAGERNVQGDGMGMAYVQVLIRRHDGSISCESKLGAGTMFTFSIPHRLATTAVPALAEIQT